MTRTASRSVAGGRTSNRADERPLGRGPHHGQLLQELVEELDRGGPLADAGRRPGPAQEQPTALLPARLQADRRGEPDRLLQRLALFGRHLGPRQPGVEQDRQVLLVLLLELLDHRLAEPGRGPPVDPARAVAGPVVAQAVIFLLLGRAVVPLPAPGLRRLALDQVPAPGQLADRRVDDQAVGLGDRDPPFQQAERRAGDQLHRPEPIPARASGCGPASGPAPAPGRAPGRRRRAASGPTAPETSRSTGDQVVLDEQRQRRGPAAVVLQGVIDDQRVAREDVAGDPARRPGACGASPR